MVCVGNRETTQCKQKETYKLFQEKFARLRLETGHRRRDEENGTGSAGADDGAWKPLSALYGKARAPRDRLCRFRRGGVGGRSEGSVGEPQGRSERRAGHAQTV